MNKRIVCPFCLAQSSSKELLFQCSAPAQKCPRFISDKLAKTWKIITPQSFVFAAKTHLSSTAKCPQCTTLTPIRCCPQCTRTLHKNIIEKNCVHITCLTNNKNDLALFVQSMRSAIEQYLSQQHQILLEGSLSTEPPFFLDLSVKGSPLTFAFHAIPWEHISHPAVATLHTQTSITAAFVPCSLPSSITPALQLLHKHANPSGRTAFVLQECEPFLSHIPPNHIFFRHTPHHTVYNMQASRALSHALKDMLIPLWGIHALSYIEEHLKKPHFFVDTAALSAENSTVPQGWKVDEFFLWALNT